MFVMKECTESLFRFKMFLKTKKGLSAVVAALLLILLVIVSMVIVWTAIANLIKDKTQKTQTCFDVGISEKILLNEDYTCFNTTDAGNKRVQFSIGFGDVEVESLIVSIAVDGNSKGFTLTNIESSIPGLINYPDGSTNIILPGKNAGKTYVAEGFTGTEVDWIKIAPMIDGTQCDVADTIVQVDNCKVLV